MRTEPATMSNQPENDYTPNRHERRANKAKQRPMIKKLTKYNNQLKQVLAKSGNPIPEDLNDVPTWSEDEVKDFKAS